MLKGQRLLREGHQIFDAGLAEAAGRTASLAGFHAAQALIFERDDRTVKAHNGVHTEFSWLSRAEPDIPGDSRGFLQRTYELKSIADYGDGPGAGVPRSEASDAIADAARLIAAVEAALGRPTP